MILSLAHNKVRITGIKGISTAQRSQLTSVLQFQDAVSHRIMAAPSVPRELSTPASSQAAARSTLTFEFEHAPEQVDDHEDLSLR